MPSDYASVDIPFVVPQTHRIRTTDDVFGADGRVLLDLLEPSGDRIAKVQVWLDSQLAACRPELAGRITAALTARPDRIQLAGPVRTVIGGEACKNDPALIEQMLEQFNQHDLDRRSYVVVIGGGAVLDAVGYAAAIAHRGIRLVRLPTTTLAQADSGVGVKNAVNWFGKKNWKGCFAVPWAVINDWTLLKSLPDRDFRCGFSEAVKVSLLKSSAEFDFLCEHAEQIAARQETASAHAIAAACWMHIQHITEGGDPFEMLEARPLDFGHWSAHRMEPLTEYSIRHGEAVAIGVAIDTVYSSLVHGFPKQDANRVLDCLLGLGLPIRDAVLDDVETLRIGLEEFRQHLGGRLTLTMLKAIGQPINVHEVQWPQMQAAIETVQNYQAP
ncbi:3-dehydroquinate synthase [Roseimaritima ulvae]|nr:3-dehydroquinate synthase [Roseimaritima ulvae]